MEEEEEKVVEGEYRKREPKAGGNPLGGGANSLVIESCPSCPSCPSYGGVPWKKRCRKVRAPPQTKRVRMVSWKGRSVNWERWEMVNGLAETEISNGGKSPGEEGGGEGYIDDGG